jgi:hypothetical protein
VADPKTQDRQPLRDPESTTGRLEGLSAAQRRAYRLISQPGGHGYGEYSGIRTASVRVLERTGLVRTGYRRVGGRDLAHAWVPVDPYVEDQPCSRTASSMREPQPGAPGRVT